jgi:hypothetical protein
MNEYDDILGNEKECDKCGRTNNVITYRQRTHYINEKDNWVTLCEDCKEANDEYWDQMWDEYYKGCL